MPAHVDHPMNAPAIDRRWYPTNHPSEWVAHTRKRMFELVRGCVAAAIGAAHRDTASADEIEMSDEVFRRLHDCAEACAQELYALGQDGNGAVAVVLAGAIAAAAPDELHPAVLRAIEQWCRDAQDPTLCGMRQTDPPVSCSSQGRQLPRPST